MGGRRWSVLRGVPHPSRRWRAESRSARGASELWLGVAHAGGGVGVGCVERLGLEQCLGEVLELVAVFFEQVCDLVVGCVDERAYLLVDGALGLLGCLAGAGEE